MTYRSGPTSGDALQRLLIEHGRRLERIERGANRGGGSSFGLPFVIGDYVFQAHETSGALEVKHKEAPAGTTLASSLTAQLGSADTPQESVTSLDYQRFGVFTASTQSIPHNVLTGLTWDATVRGGVSPNPMITATSSEVEVPLSGFYSISGQVQWVDVLSNAGHRYVELSAGALDHGMDSRLPVGSMNTVQQYGPKIYDLNGGNKITVHVRQTSGGFLSVGFASLQIQFLATE